VRRASCPARPGWPGSSPAARAAVLLIALATLPGAAPAPPAGADETVARVNGRPILRRDFNLAVQLQFQGRAPAVGLAELRAAREQILERLIDTELLFQRASKGGAEIGEAEVDAELQRLREAFGSEEAFATALRDNGVAEPEFRAQIRRSLLVIRFVDREVVGELKMTDDDLRRYYEQNPREMIRPERARVRQIVVRAPVGSLPARAAARQKIEAVLKEIKAGRDFADLARRHSEGAEAARGGDAGWLTRGNGPQAIERAVFRLQPGEMSDIVETRVGFHLLRVEERQPEGPIPFEEAREPIRQRLEARERDAKVQEYLAGLKEKARIERLPDRGVAP
jgi:parvulin-like peptidyl-prolyl isomerase